MRRSARAVLLDDNGRLVTIRRTRPGQPPYWTSPGGGVEPTDRTHEAAVERVLREELGARARVGPQVLLLSIPEAAGVSVQHFFLCRLLSIDPGLRTGPEYTGPVRGYELDRIAMSELADLDLRPVALKALITANMSVLIADLPPA
ncbi:MAG: NUDIX domain-containing protein [Pseudonocardia sp.]